MQPAHTDPYPLRSKAFGPAMLTFDTSALPERQRFEAMEAYGSPLYQLERRDGENAAFAQVQSVCGVGVMRVAHKSLRYQLKPVSTRDVDPEILLVKRVVEGRQRGMIGERAMDAKVGDVCLVDMTRPEVLESDFALTECVFIPFSRIGYDPSRHAGFAAYTAGTGLGRLIGAAVESLLAAPADARNAGDLCEALVAMLGGCVLGRIEDPRAARAIEATRRAQFRTYVETKLADPCLSVADVCRAFGASRATVYRDFADVGGIRAYIRARRLQHARIALAETVPCRGAVTRIAERYGFTSQAHFHRAFRAAFGATPGEVLGSEATSGDAEA